MSAVTINQHERVEHHGVVLEQWQWDALEGAEMRPCPQLKARATERGLSFVYFLQEAEGGAVKIGVAQDPDRRVATLQTGNPRTLVIRQLIVGTPHVERYLHGRWKRHGAHLRDEWFEQADAILEAAEEIARKQRDLLETEDCALPQLHGAVHEVMSAMVYR